jgi:uncharacterized repeat protein (TIGR03803 family)
MTRKSFLFVRNFAVCLAALTLASATLAAAQTEIVIHSFRSSSKFDGMDPMSGLVADNAGALYGTANGGGKYGEGAVYKLAPPTTQGGAWKQNILYSFLGDNTGANDGAGPRGSIVLAGSGKIYGTTQGGGQYGYGTVYELLPPTQSGGPWTETLLYNFASEVEPVNGLVAGAGGKLYGTTYLGGRYNVGSVFRLSPPALPGDPWTEATIYNFNNNGTVPQGYPTGVILDAAGSLYGATSLVNGDNVEFGLVFQLTPPSSGKGEWVENVLYAFTGEGGDGIQPSGNLVFDSAGALYGVTLGGGQFGSGAVYELSPPEEQGETWTESVLYSFAPGFSDGFAPVAALTFDSAGALWGVTQYGGIEYCGDASNGCGTAYKLSPPTTQGGPWTESFLYSFQAGSDGYLPQAPVVVVGANVYGTTMVGGTGNCNGSAGQLGCGTVFQIAQP